MFEFLASLLGDLQTIGLFYDAVGVFMLGVSVAFTPMATIVRRSASYWDLNKHTVYEQFKARVDAKCGTTVLVIGFLMQIVAAQQWLPTMPREAGYSLTAALVATLMGWGWFRRRKRMDEKVEEAMTALVALQAEAEREEPNGSAGE